MKLTSIRSLEVLNQASINMMLQQVNLSGMYKNFLTGMKEDGPVRAPGIHASEVTKCQRQAVYSLHGVEKKIVTSEEMQKRFEVGKYIHDMVQTHFEAMSSRSEGLLSFVREASVGDTELARKYCIESHCDGIFTFFDKGEPIIKINLEIKTQSPDEFTKTNQPDKSHVEQAHIYMACLDIPVTWYLYWNKGNQNYTPSAGSFLGVWNETIWAKVLKRIQYTLEMAEKNELPDREDGYHCSWCPYAWTCDPPKKSTYQSRVAGQHQHRALTK